ncbi:MAG: type II toxin-antitoxin system RelE/ParE family toxin [Terracidiphilus sp.]|jgi:addiction module RelE/StbE family toxin
MQVRWTTPAAQDLEEITLYIQRDSESAARAVAKTLFDAANSLDLMPSRGRVGRIPGTRELVVPGLPYIVVYQVTVAAIQILHIYHGARNWTGEQ